MTIEEMRKQFEQDIADASDAEKLEAVRVKYLGRKQGLLTNFLSSLKEMPLEQKREAGPKANALRTEIEQALQKQITNHKSQITKTKTIDVTMPGKKVVAGHLHLLTIVERQMREIFRGLNFSVIEGPEMESEYYNFDALNIPEHHPAREMWDTFFLKKNPNNKIQITNDRNTPTLMRTHTSPVQIRYMEKHQPPFQIIVPGRVFRFEATDASHEINFHQLEGLMVGEQITLANFKHVIGVFLHQFFGKKVEFRFRPSYFPFVEPGLEVDIRWNDRWLEVMGAGMVHPNVLKGVGYDPKQWQGFAFGLGIERFAMLKYKVDDVRLFHSGDLRFIHQF